MAIGLSGVATAPSMAIGRVLDDLGVGLGRWEHLAITDESATETKKLFTNGVLAAEAPE